MLIPLLSCKLSYTHIRGDACMREYNLTSSYLHRSIPRDFSPDHFRDTPSCEDFFFHTGSWELLLPFHAWFPDPPGGLWDLFDFDNYAFVSSPFLKMAGLRVTSSRQI